MAISPNNTFDRDAVLALIGGCTVCVPTLLAVANPNERMTGFFFHAGAALLGSTVIGVGLYAAEKSVRYGAAVFDARKAALKQPKI